MVNVLTLCKKKTRFSRLAHSRLLIRKINKWSRNYVYNNRNMLM